MGVCNAKFRMKKIPSVGEIIDVSPISESTILDNINKHYQFFRILGSGHFGVVREARKIGMKSRQTVAVKSISKKNIIK